MDELDKDKEKDAVVEKDTKAVESDTTNTSDTEVAEKEVEEFEENAKSILFKFDEYLTGRQKIMLLLAFITLIIAIIYSLFMPRIIGSIRSSQLDSVIYNDFASEHVAFFDYGKIDEELAKQEQVTVLFASPNDKSYKKMLTYLNDKELNEELRTQVYLYPLVYQAESVTSQYNLEQDKLTFVQYEKGIEKVRFTYEELRDVENQLPMYLNQMPTGVLGTETPEVPEGENPEVQWEEQPQPEEIPAEQLASSEPEAVITE
ncbi:hypothetical protein M2139_001147 [Enterococcus sp. PF1-24]|uniref:hypothetical protein n=1 Tax=unclassified Enterococcus TaxID=2608891 RepID=UPI0024734071|nr:MULTISPECIES: hypothetical protein [unclassified Enterococcus]MDH6364162.1 hypothetical protein [Enterococcus sp. PFB1-1]MDH6401263.1 hypothetical protein [Enterococcus sp. PF1-24]